MNLSRHSWTRRGRERVPGAGRRLCTPPARMSRAPAPALPRPGTWRPGNPRPTLPSRRISAFQTPARSTYRHHGLRWTQAGQVTNGSKEGVASGKVMAPTFQEAIPQLEQLRSNRATGRYAVCRSVPAPPHWSPASPFCRTVPSSQPGPCFSAAQLGAPGLPHTCCFLISASLLPLLRAPQKLPPSPSPKPGSASPPKRLSLSPAMSPPCPNCLEPAPPRNPILVQRLARG